jgi:peptide/nickel transport system substrate-binding protein
MWSLNSGPDPLARLVCYDSRTPPGACNYQRFKDADFDKLIDEAKAASDQTKMMEALKKANNLLYDKVPAWYFNYNKAVMAYQPWLHGLKPNATELAIQAYEDLWVDGTSPAAK